MFDVLVEKATAKPIGMSPKQNYNELITFFR